jgi:predicted ATPase
MSKKYITEVKVKRPNFLGDGDWELGDLNAVNVIFGKNGSGKSQVLRKIREQNQDYFYASPERAGDISFDVNIMNTQMTERGRTKSRNTNMATNYRQEAVSRIHVMYMTIADAVTRGKPAPKLQEAETLLNALLPDFIFQMAPKSPPYTLTRVSDGKPVTSTSSLSSGEAEVLSLAVDLITTAVIWQVSEQDKRVLLIDEPDTHLHPDLQVGLSQFLIELSKTFDCQLFVSTHSTTLLSALGYSGGDDVSVLFFKNIKGIQKFNKFGPELSTLSACLGGHALMGPMFGSSIFLVEGDDDYRLWTHVSRGEALKKGFAVLPCNGDQIKDY